MIPRVLLLLFLALGSRSLAADAPDADVISRITGLEPDVKNGVAKVSAPRADLTVTVDGVRMQPFQGLASWAAFTGSGAETVVMGDLTPAEDEVSPVMDAALGNSLEVTALHNYFWFDYSRILFMHLAGTGSTEKLATGVREALEGASAG